MTRDDIIRIAHETYCSRINLHTDQKASISRLERFAALVAAEEREACAKLCDKLAYHTAKEQDFHALAAAESCAEAIRARGQR